MLQQSATTIKIWERFHYVIILALCRYRTDALLIVLILHYFRFRFERTKVLFGDIKIKGSEQQIKFNGSPFKVAWLYPCHDVDNAISSKKWQIEEKVNNINNKARIICWPKSAMYFYTVNAFVKFLRKKGRHLIEGAFI